MSAEVPVRTLDDLRSVLPNVHPIADQIRSQAASLRGLVIEFMGAYQSFHEDVDVYRRVGGLPDLAVHDDTYEQLRRECGLEDAYDALHQLVEHLRIAVDGR